jgi:hypothetical protein
LTSGILDRVKLMPAPLTRAGREPRTADGPGIAAAPPTIIVL